MSVFLNSTKGYTTIVYLLFLILVVIVSLSPAPDPLSSYVYVLLVGSIFSAIELGSRYKDEPLDAISSWPGFFYIFVNGLICCCGYYLIVTFSLNISVPDYLNESAQKASDILMASITSFLVMRSSFLTLGSESNQIDIGLSVIIKKLILIVDRQVDRHQAAKRAKNITEILDGVSLDQIRVQVLPFCLQVMQNVPKDEVDGLVAEIDRLELSEPTEMQAEAKETKKLQAGLLIYTLVGYQVLQTAIKQLKLPKANSESSEPEVSEEQSSTNAQPTKQQQYRTFFDKLIEEAKSNTGEQRRFRDE